MRTTQNGFTASWEVFVVEIVARENLPKWECMWDDFIQEEILRESLHRGQQRGDEEENLDLTGNSKGKAKKNPNGGGYLIG